ncbi:MAG: Stp1/IreP family PP2C-type Ser/Thr phosphatase [Oscillospiraceae bacterium]|nr:Stp1/IreP family PP2C-type Ser/Thr phosphatase [Oscillospiraceae bacterium]MBR5260750.1 Stp1/IreP family PP2C-type Ser/Thr phosphatase [Oscillospiraceae bacterium]
MRAYGMTDRGCVRKENQDAFKISTIDGADVVTAVLCDGMGGAQAGSVASQMACDAFMFHAANSIDEKSTVKDMNAILTEAVRYANVKVYDKSFADFTCMGMGSTLVAIALNSKRAMVCNVGDSRAYLYNGSVVEQITHDHSLVEEMVERGKITREEAESHPNKNVITRAIGVEATVKCDIFDLKLRDGDKVLLCSDGLTNLVSDEEIASVLMKNPELENACLKLVTLALQRGAPDNVTVVLVER